MGDCKYCNKPAGLFQNKHAECEKNYWAQQKRIDEGEDQVRHIAISAVTGSVGFDDLKTKISQIEAEFSVPESNSRLALIAGWESAVTQFINQGVLEKADETRLVQFKKLFALTDDETDQNGVLTKITKAAVLRDLVEGTISHRQRLGDTNFSINFQKGEEIVWAFEDCSYLEDKTRREYVGGSSGVSMRVMKGVYYHVGAFKGHTVEHTDRTLIDTGWVVVTTKNIYFSGSHKSLRLPYGKILSFLPFDNGIGILRDATTAKPQIFITGDGWFTHNLVVNLSKL